MTILEDLYFGNTLQVWATALVIAAVTFFGLKILQRVVVHRVGKMASRTTTEVDDLVVDVLRSTRMFFLLAVSAYAGSLGLTLPDHVSRLVQTAVVLSLLVQGALWGNRVVSFVLGRALQRRMEKDAASTSTIAALGFVTRLLLWCIVLLLALDNMGVNVTGLVAGLGIGGIAVALALQNILGDLFASLSIVLDKPFVVGDFIIVDDLLGTVEYIGLKTTRIRSLSGEQIVFSNTDLLGSRIRNFKRMYERRIAFSLGVTYQTSYETLAQLGSVLRTIVESVEGTRFDRAHFKGYGPSSLDFEVVYFVQNPDYNVYMDIQQKINLEIYRRFAELGVEFAYPTQTVHVHPASNGEVVARLTEREAAHQGRGGRHE
jgi:small-conductance mechanosensitive channel